MPSTGEKKLAQMRAYSKTPAGKAAHSWSHEKQLDKRRDGRVMGTLKINPQPLLQAVANWR